MLANTMPTLDKYSYEPSNRYDEIVLQNCTIHDLESGGSLYDIPGFYLAKSFDKVTIEINNS